jgi:CheY-like chemotaxis protein
VTAPDGRAAVRLFAEERFDAILMDCEMPIMDGLEATRRIREIEKMEGAPDEGQGRQGHTPVIALTAHALNEIRDRCFAAGMDDFLTKPFDDRQMEEALLRWLKPSGARPAASGPAEEISTSEDGSDGKHSRGQVLDLTVLDKLRSLDRPGKPSRFGRTVSKFSEIGPPLVAAIKENQSKNDAEALWRSAHSLKSSAGALGAVGLSERCAQIEKLAQDARLDETRRLVDALENDLTEVIEGLETAMGEMKRAN